MTKSDQINELAAALSKAQGEMKTAKNDSENPFYRATYTSLAGCWEAARAQLAKNGLAVIQSPSFENDIVTLETLLTHSSGQWIESKISCRPGYIKDGKFVLETDAQAIGSVTAYLRRYSLCPIIGITTDSEDDDGESNVKGKAREHQPSPMAKPLTKHEKVKQLCVHFQKAGIPEEFVIGLSIKAKLCPENSKSFDDFADDALSKMLVPAKLATIGKRWMEKQDTESPLPEQTWGDSKPVDPSSQPDAPTSTDQEPITKWQEVTVHEAGHNFKAAGKKLGQLKALMLQFLYDNHDSAKTVEDAILRKALNTWHAEYMAAQPK